MANDLKSDGVTAPIPGGENGNEGQDNQKNEKPSTVSRDAYEKAISDAKKAKERLSALEADAKKRGEEELKAKEDWKKLAELRAAEAEEWKGKFNGLNTSVAETRKLNAVLSKLPGKVASDYWNLLD